MELPQRLAVLADSAKYDASCASCGVSRRADAGGIGATSRFGVCHSWTPDGRCVSLLKVLLTNYCIYDCQYCVNRISADVPRARLQPAEVAYVTIEFYRRNYIEGLFLSSGVIRSPDYTVEQMAEVVRLLREVHRFAGYVHLKIVPGASAELIARAGRYADRLSANIELPTDGELRQLAPQKTTREVESSMSEIRDRHRAARAERRQSKRAPSFAPAGQSTQLIVGATPSPDATILGTAARLYRGQGLRRVYYSAFNPIPNAAAILPRTTPPLVREHRLYQADWLLRYYGFDVSELTTAAVPNLDLQVDPKLAWALRNRDFFPVDVNHASKEALLRVPGLGVRNAMRILALRARRRLRLADLRRLRVAVKRAEPFIVTADANPAVRTLDSEALPQRMRPRNGQLNLFEAAAAARSGEL